MSSDLNLDIPAKDDQIKFSIQTRGFCIWRDNLTHISTSDNYNCNVNFNCSDTINCSDLDSDDNLTELKTAGLSTDHGGDPENPGALM